MSYGVRNVFISFDIDDESQVRLLTYQARQENTELNFRDYSVKEAFPKNWKSEVRDKISQTSVTMVAIGSNTAESSAVEYEIEESYAQGKHVFGVRLYGNANHPIPESLEHDAPIVNWNLKDIQREIDNAYL